MCIEFDFDCVFWFQGLGIDLCVYSLPALDSLVFLVSWACAILRNLGSTGSSVLLVWIYYNIGPYLFPTFIFPALSVRTSSSQLCHCKASVPIWFLSKAHLASSVLNHDAVLVRSFCTWFSIVLSEFVVSPEVPIAVTDRAASGLATSGLAVADPSVWLLEWWDVAQPPDLTPRVNGPGQSSRGGISTALTSIFPVECLVRFASFLVRHILLFWTLGKV